MFFLRDNLPRIKDGAYVINLDDRQSKGTYWVSLFITSFETEGISQEVLRNGIRNGLKSNYSIM